MSDRLDLVKSWFKIANEDILVAQQLMKYEDPILLNHGIPIQKV